MNPVLRLFFFIFCVGSLSIGAVLAHADDANSCDKEGVETDLSKQYHDAKVAYEALDRSNRMQMELLVDSSERLAKIFDHFREGLTAEDRANLYAVGLAENKNAENAQAAYLKATPAAQKSIEKLRALWANEPKVSCRKGFEPQEGDVIEKPVFDLTVGSFCVRKGEDDTILAKAAADSTRGARLEKSDPSIGLATITVCESVLFSGARIGGAHRTRYCSTQSLAKDPHQDVGAHYGVAGGDVIDGVDFGKYRTLRAYLDYETPLRCEQEQKDDAEAERQGSARMVSKKKGNKAAAATQDDDDDDSDDAADTNGTSAQ